MRLNLGPCTRLHFTALEQIFVRQKKSSTNHLSSATKQADVIGIPEFDKKIPIKGLNP